MHDWAKYPYSCFKMRFNTELSVIITFISQYTPITPNFLTFMFAFLGLLSGIFLASDINILIFISR